MLRDRRTSVDGWQRELPRPRSAAVPRLMSAVGAVATPLQPRHCRLHQTVAAIRRGRRHICCAPRHSPSSV
eukprot:363596-Chlamydomonas_euryale.AAC.4